MKIAISGKGGTGKTTFSAHLARVFVDRGYNVYAVDADPDANLAFMLDIKEEVKPLSQLEEVIQDRVGGDGGMFSLNPEVDDVLQEYSIQQDGISFLRMGSVKKASSSCYCAENSFLRAVLNSLVFRSDDAVILDMGAGIEHLTRGTAAGVDVMLVVCEPTPVSVETAHVIEGLADEAGIGEVAFIGNKIMNERQKEFLRENLPETPLAFVNYDETLLSLNGNNSSEAILGAAEDVLENLIGGG